MKDSLFGEFREATVTFLMMLRRLAFTGQRFSRIFCQQTPTQTIKISTLEPEGSHYARSGL
jgi:hypothetical protein